MRFNRKKSNTDSIAISNINFEEIYRILAIKDSAQIESREITLSKNGNCKVRRNPDGVYVSPVARDPWLLFQHSAVGPGTIIIWLEIELSSNSQEHPTIYIDHGEGFSEDLHFELQRSGNVWFYQAEKQVSSYAFRVDLGETNVSPVKINRGGIARYDRIIGWIPNDGMTYTPKSLDSHSILKDIPLEINNFDDLSYEINGRNLIATSTSNDPQMVFTLDFAREGDATIWMQLASALESPTPPSVYLDYGNGFSEDGRFKFINKDNIWSVTNVLINGLRRIRVDPLEQSQTKVNISRIGITLNITNSGSFTGSIVSSKVEEPAIGSLSYQEWLSLNEVGPGLLELQRRRVKNAHYCPLISLIVPIYKVETRVLRKLVDCLISQTYYNWELCAALSYYDDKELIDYCKNSVELDARIKLLEITNGGISVNSNEALKIACGDYIVLLDHDDVLPINALYELAEAARQNPEASLFYSDKDMITDDGEQRFSPLFKPDWSPDMMLNVNYLTHLNMIKRERLEEIGGWDSSKDGAQDWDLFLRVAQDNRPVIHVPKVLYNWRIVPTSVASGGLAVKPYAAQAQLSTVKRHLAYSGWLNAEPVFASENLIKIQWSSTYKPSVTLILIGDGKAPEWTQHQYNTITHILSVSGDFIHTLNDIIGKSASEVVAIIPAGLHPLSDDWLRQLTGPLQNPEIGVSAGKVLGQSNEVIDAGWISIDSVLKPIFSGQQRHAYSYIGSVDWFRNLNAASFASMAFRRNDFEKIDGFRSVERPDLDFSIRLSNLGTRILFNPFAESWLPNYNSFERLIPTYGYHYDSKVSFHNYFNKNLTIGGNGEIQLKKPAISNHSSHDYSGESQYTAATYDFTNLDIQRSLEEQTATKLKMNFTNRVSRVAWIIPDFSMPFYGGVLTILRCAEFMRSKHGVQQIFVGFGAASVENLRSAIAKAYPGLAKNSEIFLLSAGEDINSIGLGELDASICTLWTTAYPMLALRNVRQKFYFVQDYEPLFYPAGSTSLLAEATYNFGYIGICNTQSLAKLYRQLGGVAYHFDPAVDREVFYPSNNRKAYSRKPVLIFSYARPGHPRNCFEVITAAFRDVKNRLGNEVQIITAGSDWSPREYALEGVVEHLGLLSYEQTGELYRACDMGVVAMATRHPSYLPFELMACGAVTLTNRSSYTDWLLKDGENSFLFEMSRSSVSDKIISAVQNPAVRERVAETALQLVKDKYYDWDRSCITIFDLIRGGLN